MKTAAALALAGALTLCACGSSPPTRFYVLEPVASATARAEAPAGAPVKVAAVHLPEELDRLEMVSGLGPNRIQVRGEDRWAAPLDDMSRRVLTQDLAQRLPPGMLLAAQSPAPRAARLLVVDLQEFGPAGDRVRLQGSWSLQTPGGEPLLRRDVELNRSVADADPRAQAAAMSRLLGELADGIAMDLGAQSATAR